MGLHVDLLSRPIRVNDELGGHTVHTSAARTELVLAILVLAGGERVDRDFLADAVWPDRLPRTWESALRSIVAEVRSIFIEVGLEAESLRSEQQGYRLLLPDNTEVDAERATEAVKRAERAAGTDTESAIVDADFAARTLVPSLLPDHEGVWVSLQRSDLSRLRIRALEIGAECALQLRRRGAAAERAETLIAIDELREYNHQLLIRAHLADGDRALAVRAFERCRQMLAAELGIEPSAETLQLGQEARGDTSGSVQPRVAPPVALENSSLVPQFAVPFIGRDGELARLDQAWMRSRSGGRVIAIIEGEAGIGKTRLAYELARLIGDRDGAVVLVGHNDEQRLGPYQPFVEAFGRYSDMCDPDQLERQLGSEASLLRDTFERTRSPKEAGDVYSSEIHDAGQQPRFAAFAAFLSRIAADAPTLLLLDDVHWIGPDSVALLRYLLRHGTGPLLVLGTARLPELSESDPLAELLLDAARSETLERIELDGFDNETSAVYAAAILDVDVDESTEQLAFDLHERSLGNPFFLGELVRLHSSAGEVESALPEIPTGVRSMIRSRRRRLDDVTNDVLDAASVIGCDFDVEVLRELHTVAHINLEDALDDASDSMLIHEGSGPGSYRFSHQLVHDAVYVRIRAMRRARLHLEVGEALERLRAKGRRGEPASLAYHFVAARGAAPDPERTVGYVLDAARRCIETFAYDEALDQVGVALELASSDAARCRALLIQGTALQRRGDATEAHAAFEEAVGLARSLGSGVELAEAALGLAVGGRGVSAWLTDDIRRSLLDEAIETLGVEQPLLRIQLLGALAEASYGPEHWDTRHALAEEAVELARSLGDAASLGAALEATRVALWGPGNTVRRLEATNAIMELAVRLDDDALKLRSCIGRLCDLVELGDRDDFDAELARGHDLADELRQPIFSWELTLMDAMIAFAEGRRLDAEQLATDSEEIWGFDEAPDADRAREEQVSLMGFAAGEIDMATAESVGDVVTQHPELGAYVCVYPFVLASVGSLDEARQRLDAIAARDYADVPQHSSWLFAVALLSEAAVKVGSVERATELMQMLAPHVGRLVFLVGPQALWGSVDHQVGILSALLGQMDEAIAHLEAAVEIEERFGSPSFAERSRLQLNRIRGMASAHR